MVMWNLQIKILYMLGHSDSDKDNNRESKSDLRLHNFIKVYLGTKQLSGSNKLTE